MPLGPALDKSEGATRACSTVLFRQGGVPAFMTLGPSLPTAAGGEGQGAGGHHTHTTSLRGQLSCALSLLSRVLWLVRGSYNPVSLGHFLN